ncbi:DUF3830 family protein [Cupriavidus necator H16]|uniref:DUF3830 family protein n=2 Tax=Cupriavidus necator (strain ATCC 17699 / DSM 428 / KCTC 22496 / NCIMB 10442 / H16 / Stanier 337) TaxID=381666 RepID=A0AAF1D4P2_CUPNH|nr:DUF3830 family protein [Cupriavidus necator H16]
MALAWPGPCIAYMRIGEIMDIEMKAGPYSFLARLEQDLSPAACDWLMERLPAQWEFLQGRWSGHAVFARLGGTAKHIGNGGISRPAVGQILLYGGNDDVGGELLIPYGPTRFACPSGELSGHHVLTVTTGQERLADLGALIHERGGLSISYRRCSRPWS